MRLLKWVGVDRYLMIGRMLFWKWMWLDSFYTVHRDFKFHINCYGL